MSEEMKDEKRESQIDEFARQTGATKVGHSIPERLEKSDFSSIPGVRCVMQPPRQAENKPEESVEKLDDAIGRAQT